MRDNRTKKLSKRKSKDYKRDFPIIDSNGDFIFRFDLSLKEKQPIYEDPIVEMLREQICNILNVVVLTSSCKEIKIDGFKFLNDLNLNYGLFVKSIIDLKALNYNDKKLRINKQKNK